MSPRPKMNKEEYREYLKSDHWQNLRKRKLSHSRRRCAICSSIKRLEVHHLQYRNIFDVDLTDLRILCNRCHKLFHELKKSGVVKPVTGSHQKQFANARHYVRLALGMIRPRRNERKLFPSSPLFVLGILALQGMTKHLNLTMLSGDARSWVA